MFTLFNYLKNFETKITEAEVPELQFLDLEHYKNEQFNINSYVGVVMSKLNDTNYLIKQLKITIENLKNEIVAQINSNFSNYVVLISKLQAIDFLVDNIDKPLQSIKKRITSEINYVEKYEEEIKEIIRYLNENISQINVVNQVLNFYKQYNKANSISKLIDKKYENNYIIHNILSRSQDESIFKSRNYEILRKYLVDVFRFVSYSSKLKKISEFHLCDKKIYDDVKTEETKLFNNVEEILKLTIEDYLKSSKDSSDLEITLQKNIMYLILQIYITSDLHLLVLDKIYEIGEISKVIESSKSLPSKIEELQNIHSSKFKWIEEIFINISKETQNDFYLHLYIIPLVKKIQIEKIIFNCVDPITFKDNYSSLINYIGNVLIIENFELSSESYFEQIKTFLHSFSFFTFFQYLQSEISKTFYDTLNTEEILNNIQNSEYETVMSKCLSNYSNLFFNFTKSLRDMLKEKKIFLKILPNFINFTLQCNNLIILRHNELFKNLEQIQENTNLREVLIEYFNNLINLVNYFTPESHVQTSNINLFHYDMMNVINREKFMLASIDDYKSIVNNINLLITSTYCRLKENIIEQETFKKVISFPEIKEKIKLNNLKL